MHNFDLIISTFTQVKDLNTSSTTGCEGDTIEIQTCSCQHPSKTSLFVLESIGELFEDLLISSHYSSLFLTYFLKSSWPFLLLIIPLTPLPSSASPPGSLRGGIRFANHMDGARWRRVTCGPRSYIIRACKVSSPVRLGFSSSGVVSVLHFSLFLRSQCARGDVVLK